MPNFRVTFPPNNHEIAVGAPDQVAARREAMAQRYGEEPSKVVPHAPKYNSDGLRVEELKNGN